MNIYFPPGKRNCPVIQSKRTLLTKATEHFKGDTYGTYSITKYRNRICT
uniref:Uncharacterized protein n=1 Tax=Rhizophora mucronata TaxID=61149 RepID=A0A2P2QQS9_RHIMU